MKNPLCVYFIFFRWKYLISEQDSLRLILILAAVTLKEKSYLQNNLMFVPEMFARNNLVLPDFTIEV